MPLLRDFRSNGYTAVASPSTRAPDGFSTANRQLVGGNDLADQARQAFRNVQTVVEAIGGTVGDVVSLRIYVVDYAPEKAEAVGKALRECFNGPAKPATTWIGVVSLADPGFLIEIEATAVLD